MKYTQRNEFLDFFGEQKISFFSNTSKQYPYLDLKQTSSASFEIKKISNMERVFDYVETIVEEKGSKPFSCFILSSLKHQSRELFESFYQKNIHQNTLLLAENIT